MEAENLS